MVYILDPHEKDEDRAWREAAVLGGKKMQTIEVTRIEWKKGSKGEYPIVFFLSPKGDEWKKNVFNKEAAEVFKSGPGKYEVSIDEVEVEGKTYENFVSPAKFLGESKETTPKAQEKRVLDQQRGMVFSSVVNAVKDIAVAHITTGPAFREEENEPSNPLTPEEQIIKFSRGLLNSLLDGVEDRLNGTKQGNG